MGAPYHGKNGLIYVSGVEVVGMNAWSIAKNKSSVATPQAGHTSVDKVAGQYEWTVSINAWDQGDANPLQDAADYDGVLPMLIYPTRSTLTRYWSGNAIFSMAADGGTAAAVSQNATGEGAGDLTATGWS